MNNSVRALISAGLVFTTFGIALAKLPPPPPLTDEQKAAAEQKKAKDAASAAEQKAALDRAMDRVASRYIAEMKAKGVEVHPTPVTAPPTAPTTTAQGNTPATSAPGQNPDAAAAAKNAPSPPATGPGASKDSSKK